MDANKLLFRGLKVGVIILVVLLIAYATMRASFVAYDYGYRYAIHTLMGDSMELISAESTENTEGTGK